MLIPVIPLHEKSQKEYSLRLQYESIIRLGAFSEIPVLVSFQCGSFVKRHLTVEQKSQENTCF